MPKITARRCRFTNEVFESDFKFGEHLKALREEKKRQRDRRATRAKMNEVFRSIRETVRCAADMEKAIMENWPTFVATCSSDREVGKHPDLVSINITFDWDDQVSNSHSAPIGKKTNWRGDLKNEPRSYPGWKGKISYKLSHDSPGWNSDYFCDPNCGINTGSGGGGWEHSRYALDLFAEDWPLMAAPVTWAKLQEVK